MNYILSQIDRKIALLKANGKKTELKIHYQSKFEYYLTLMIGYLWNKNIEEIGIEDKEYVINTILKPSIGSIISTSRTLDIKSELFGNKHLKKFYNAVNFYPQLRNERIGHGFSFEDDIDSFLESFEDLFEKINNSGENIFTDNHDLIAVESYDKGIYKGVNYKSNGVDYNFWSCPKEVQDFKLGSLYLYSDRFGYNRISPFFRLIDENEIYIFSSIEEKLTGRVKYNRIVKTGKHLEEFEEFASFILDKDEFKKKSANGTIINSYDKNYKEYFDVGITDKIIKFATKSNSSVFATLWGHGGIGKTAAMQNASEILCNQERKKFDYIIFLSAKDRFYNYYQNKIEELSVNITSFEQIITQLNKLLFSVDSFEIERIINFEGKLLLTIDDFETFSKEEKIKITDFVKKLNINHHKVIFTTRSATLITGEEIITNELGELKTFEFFIKVLSNDNSIYENKGEQKKLKKYIKSIHKVTSGRPLFILQLSILFLQKGSIEEVLEVDISSSKEANKFLYDRIYDYLSLNAKNMFLALSLLANPEDLTGLLSNLMFILNKEDETEEFENSLQELIKLKIIDTEGSDFFRVYSFDILKLMQHYYENKGEEYDGGITSRFNHINNQKNKPTDLALLAVADSKRVISNEREIEGLYRQILNRKSAPDEVKIKAIINLGNYFHSQKGKLNKTIKLFKDYSHKFSDYSIFVIMNARFHWVEGSTTAQYQAIDIIKNFLGTKPKIKEDLYLELLGTWMTYSVTILVRERENLKIDKRNGEIDKGKYHMYYRIQRERFFDVSNIPGKKLYSIIEKKNLMDYDPNSRNFILDGLVNYVEVLIRINDHDSAVEVCKKIIDELPINFHPPFSYKLTKINKIVNSLSSKIVNSNYIKTDLGEKLEIAIEKGNKTS